MVSFGQAEISMDAFIQYGCFGLLAMLVVWLMWKGIPYFLETHRAVIQDMAAKNEAAMQGISEAHKVAVGAMLASFERESEQCRQERITEGERNRQANRDIVVEIRKALGTEERK